MSGAADLVDQDFIDGVMHVKEQKVANADFSRKHSDDVTPMLKFYDRDREEIAFVTCARLERDDALSVAMILIPGLDVESVSLMTDAHVTSSPVNPATGEAWGHLGMQNACDNDGACSLGVITDCLTISGVHADGRAWNAIRTYHVNPRLKQVHWVPEQYADLLQEERPTCQHCRARIEHRIDKSGDVTWVTADDALCTSDKHELGDGTYVTGLIVDALLDFFDARAAHGTPMTEMVAGMKAEEPGISDRECELACVLALSSIVGSDPRWIVSVQGRTDEEQVYVDDYVRRHNRRMASDALLAEIRDGLAAENGKRTKSGLFLP